MTDSPILIVGAGSIGERHIRTLWQLGHHNLIVFRQRNLPFRDIAGAEVTVLTDWQAVLDAKPLAAVICTPTSHHLQQTKDSLEAGMHVLVEKPLSHTLFDSEELLALAERQNRLVQVGYMLRYHPLLLQVKALTEQKTYGNLINIQTYWGEYLPGWHPWENYREGYAARKDLGGGPALTLSHDIDVCCWLAGSELKAWQSMHNHASKLEVTTESAFDVNLAFRNKVTAHAHLNFCQRVGQRSYRFIFDEAIVDIDYYTTTLTIATPEGKEQRVVEGFDRNDMFVAQDKDFLERIASGHYNQFTRQQIEQSYQIIRICNEGGE